MGGDISWVPLSISVRTRWTTGGHVIEALVGGAGDGILGPMVSERPAKGVAIGVPALNVAGDRRDCYEQFWPLGEWLARFADWRSCEDALSFASRLNRERGGVVVEHSECDRIERGASLQPLQTVRREK